MFILSCSAGFAAAEAAKTLKNVWVTYLRTYISITEFHIRRFTEVELHKLILQPRCLELAVMLREAQHLLAREPVLEALAVEGVGLAVYAVVVEGVLARREDAIDLEGQPAP